MNLSNHHLRRVLRALLAIGLVGIGAAPLASAAPKKRNPTSKLFVTDTQGGAEIETEERIVELTKKSVHTAQGTVIETKKVPEGKTPESVTSSMVYSNGTGIHFDPDTRLEVKKFVQEPFTPNRTDMEMEPSISQTQTFLSRGSVGVCTSKLVAGSSMVYQTSHGAVNIRGRKVVIEANDKFTKISMLEGDSTIRGGTGSAVDMGGQTLHAGEQAYIRPGPVGQPPMIKIEKIPPDEMSSLDDKTAMACMAKKTVYFEVADRKTDPGAAAADEPAAEAETADGEEVTAFDGDTTGEPRQEIIPVEVVPIDLPVQSVVSPSKLGTG